MGERGILTGCDAAQEWLLPWWYRHLRAHSDDPVAFADFGMSEEARRWAAERGRVIDATQLPFELQPVPLNRGVIGFSEAEELGWQGMERAVAHLRQAWFKKPLACVQFPFEQTVWLDLDCEVRGPLEPLFHVLWLTQFDVAIAREPIRDPNPSSILQRRLLPGEETYNSGVIAFRRNAPLIRGWYERAARSSGEFTGDQDALSREIFLTRAPLYTLPDAYNYRSPAPDPHAVIIHYAAQRKEEIRAQIMEHERR
jgi:hypothetical protein